MGLARQIVEIIEGELPLCRKILALEINMARWLDDGDVDQSARVQAEAEGLVSRLRPLPDLLRLLPGHEKATPEFLRTDPLTTGPYNELVGVMRKIQNLNDKNQRRVRELMEKVGGDLRDLRKSRTALRGYHSQQKRASQYLDGKL